MSNHFINCDWGTSRLRLRAVHLDPWQVTTEFVSDDGVASIAQLHDAAARPAAFASLLAEGISPLVAEEPRRLADAPILISGMASSSIGWRELPYAALPQPVDGSGLVSCELEPIATNAGRHRVVLISGVRSESDVLRGEETELVGLFALESLDRLGAAALVIKPGTHSKHLTVRSGELVSFQTFMTGELFDILSNHSVLRHSLDTALPDLDDSQQHAALQAGVHTARERSLSAALFRVRTRQLLEGASAAANRAFLSGVLLGSELAYLTGLGESLSLVLCATEPLATQYRLTLDALGLTGRLTVIAAAEVEMLSARGQGVLAGRLMAAN